VLQLEEQLKLSKDENKSLAKEILKFTGHCNSKQKIHYVESLKSQLQSLLEENTKLKSSLK
jgi:hypothetical protein